MNDEEVEVLSTDQEQPEETEAQGSGLGTTRKTTANDTIDNIGGAMDSAGKTLENFGKGEERVADFIDGGSTTVKAASDVGTATSSAVEKGTEAASKVADAKSKAAHATAETAKAGKEAAKAGRVASEGAEKAAQAGKAASKAAESNQYTAAAGAAGKALSTAADIAAKAGKTAATTAEAGAGATEAAARATEAEANAEKAGLKAADAGAKAAKAGNKAASKAGGGSFSDKLRERGKLNQIRGKRLQDQAKKFDSDKFFEDTFDKLGKGGRALGKILKGIASLFDPKIIGVITLLILILGTIFVTYILSPMFLMNEIKESIADPDRVEKVGNYLSGLGFQDSKEAFYKEVDYLNNHYGKEIDFPYIMSALYYVDIYYKTSEYYLTDDTSKFCDKLDLTKDSNKITCSNLQVGYNFAKYYLKESSSTTGDDGLTYSANKLYRLRELARNQFLGDKTPSTMGLIDYTNKVKSDMDNEMKQISEYIPLLFVYALLHFDPGLGTITDTFLAKYEGNKVFTDLLSIVSGTNSWEEMGVYIKNGKYSEAFTDFSYLIETIYNSYFNIKIRIELPSGTNLLGMLSLGSEDSVKSLINNYIKVDYYEYTYSQDEFENYLIDHYIREMPEFLDLIRDDEGKISDEKVEKICYEIKLTKEIFDSLYKTDESAQEYSSCIGDINVDLLNELVPPIDLTAGQKITFSGSNNFGYYKGVKHNGVDLEESSTGTKAGANVYSIYDGKILESTADGTFTNKTVKGGWLLIEYTIQYEDSSIGDSKLSKNFKSQLSTIRVYYGGLNPSNLTLKKGSVVKKGDIIGHVGDATASENGLKPSLHFGVYDMKSRLFLNPINIFISCDNNKKSSSSNKTTTTTTTTNVTLSSSKVLEVHKVSITRDNFIKTINKYKKSGSCGAACKRLLNDPGLVYDYSVKYNVNPELVVTRAHYEGFVPNNNTKTNYNFWSIGCYNTTKGKCAKYSTLEAGIKGFANSVKNYKNIDSMMQKYGYIGDYWYNPGNSGDGGCYFYKYIKKYMTDENRVNKIAIACKKENKCPVYGNHKNCLKTTAADQTAYKKYNVALMNSFFNKWFKKYH